MIPAHFAALLRSLIRLTVLYGLCVIVGNVIYHGGEIMRLKEQRGKNAQFPPELAQDLDEMGLSDEQIEQIARFLTMKRP